MTPETEAMVDDFEEKMAKTGVKFLLFVDNEESTLGYGTASLEFVGDVIGSLLDMAKTMNDHFDAKESSDVPKA